MPPLCNVAAEVPGVYPWVMIEGVVDAGAWSCGMFAGLIYDIPSCRTLTNWIMTQAQDIITAGLMGAVPSHF